jgi:hypothetical protein
MSIKSRTEYIRPEWRRLHNEALQAWAHAVEHGDTGPMHRIVMRYANRRPLQISLINWFVTHIGFTWDIHRSTFEKNRGEGEYFTSSEAEARDDPFWNYYEKRDVVYHKSGNLFEQKKFFDDILDTLRRQKEDIDPALLRYFINNLNRFL